MPEIWQPSENYFPALRKLVADKGLYKPNIKIPLFQLVRSLVFLASTVVVASLFSHPLVVALCATFAGFFILELGYVMHDAGHRQCSKSTQVNNVIGYIATAVIGVPFTVWIEAHNDHHNNPNHDDEDPDVGLPLIAFSEGQVHTAKRSAYKLFISYQTWFYLPLLTLIMYSKRYYGLLQIFMQPKKTPGQLLDIALIAAWHVWYPALLLFTLGPVPSVVFFFVQQAMSGFFFGMVFAPNHKGMPIIEQSMDLDFMTRQVVTSRNVHPSPVVDYLFGGLNYQIEHHLFPNMPRYNMLEAKKITEKYCKQHDIPYYETSLIGSYREIYRTLNEVAKHARALRRPMEDIRKDLLESIDRLRRDISMTTPVTQTIEKSGQLMNDRLSEIERNAKQENVHLETLGEWRHEVLEHSTEVLDWIQEEAELFAKNAKQELGQMIAKLPPQKVAAIRYAHEQTVKKLDRIQLKLAQRKAHKKEVVERRKRQIAELVQAAKQRLQVVGV